MARESPISAPDRRALVEDLLRSTRPVVSDLIPRAEPGEASPLSFAQERLWFLDQLDPGASTYHIARAFGLRGRLEVEALSRAVWGLLCRHEVLRTGFELGGEGPRQRVRPPTTRPSAVPVVELGALRGHEADSAAFRLARAEARRPFELAIEPALRLTLIRFAPFLGSPEHRLLLTVHHIAADGTSFPILYRELSALYAEATGDAPEARLEPLAVQYADFALWQRQRLQESALDRLLGWWRQELAGAPRAIELPADRPRPRAFSSRGAGVRWALPPATTTGLYAFAAASGSTPFAVGLTVFAALVSRLAGSVDLLLGTAVAERRRKQLEGLVGMFVNTVVLRLELGGRPGLDSALSRVRQATSRALAHQELPFERLVEALETERDFSRPPLVQLMVLWQREEADGLRLPGLEVEAVPRPREESQLELSLAFVESPQGLLLHAQYATSLFDASRVHRLLGQLARLLEAALAEPGRPLASLPLFSPAERHQLTFEWSDTATAQAECATTLVDWVEEALSARPEAVAVVDGHERWSCRELASRVAALAARLAALGAGPERVVGVSLPRTFELVVTLLAVQRSGAAYLPLDPAYPEERLAFMIADSDAFAVVAGEREWRRLPLASRERLPHWVRPGEGASEPDSARFRPALPGNLAYLIYTSGSTGRPKAVAIEHRSAVALLAWARRTFSREELSGVLMATSMAFDLSVFELFATLSAGGKLILGENALSLAELPARHEVVLLNTVPGAASELERAGALPESLRVINLAGEPLPGSLARRLHALPRPIHLWNLYGPSEDTTYSTQALVPVGTPERWGEPTLGRPLTDTEALVFDRAGELAPLGVPGELWLAGAGLARGYLGRPGLTAERFRPHPLGRRSGARAYRTGDLVRWLAWGELEFLGRFDHQIKVRGYRIELGEIEAALLAEPEVYETVVVARSELGSARLVAYVAGRPGEAGRAPLAPELTAALARRLPAPMVPANFVVLPALPRLPNGKVDRRALPDPSVEAASSVSSEPPRGRFEVVVAAIFSELLGLPAVGRRDDFFALGGHSLLAVQVISRLRRELGVALPLKELFERPRVEDLAAAVSARAVETASAPPPLVRTDEEPPVPSFAQERMWFLDQLSPGDPAYNLPLVVRLGGRPSLAALANALGALLERHEALSTVFSSDGVPRLVPARLPLAEVDLSRLEGGEHLALRLARIEAHRPFDLALSPLLRARWLSWSGRRGLLLLTQHHIASDGWSIGVLLRELEILYAAALEGRRAELPALPIRYRDFAAWQRRLLNAETLASRLGVWRQRLAGALERLELPTDRPRPALATSRGGRWGWQLDAGSTAALTAVGREHRATLAMVLLAAYVAWLGRRSGQRDLVLGLAVAGRDATVLEGLVGFFVNTLPLRFVWDGEPTLAESLEQARRRVHEALGSPEVPFEKLVEALSPARDGALPPLLQTMFSFDPASGRELNFSGLEAERLPAESNTAKLDLSFAASPRAGGLWLAFEYNSDLFDRTSVVRWAAEIRALLAAMAAGGGTTTARALGLSAVERHQLLIEWSDTAAAQPEHATLPACFGAQVGASPEAIAVSTADPLGGSELWSYGALSSRAHRRALALVAAGVGPEHRVGIEARRSVETVEAILAVVLAGAAYVPIDPEYPEERRRFLASDSGLERMLGLDTPLPLSHPATATLPAVLPDNLCYLIYTSGSTGRPKGVAVTHRNVVRLIFGGGYARLDREARVLAAGSVSFDASTFELWGPLLSGGRLEIFPAGGPELAVLSSFILARRVTTVLLTTGLFNSLVEEQPEGLSEVREVMTGGDSMSARHARLLTVAPHGQHLAVLGRRLLNVYGPTEGTTFATAHPLPTGVEPRLPPPIGRAIGNTRLVVAGPGGEELPLGVPGELLIGGLGLARGYWNRPALTAERFVPAGSGNEAGARLYRSGDRVRFLATGELELLGRLDGQVKIRGFRVEVGEIEATLTSLAGVREARVVARPTGGDKRLVAYLVASAGGLDLDGVRLALGERLPAFLVPAAFVLLPELPLTAHGKLDHRALPEPQWGDEQVFTPPVGAIEEKLAALFRDLLEAPAVGRHDDFFALGGHSLLATRLVSRLRREVGVELPLKVIFARPRLSELAAEVERATRSSEELPLVALEHHHPPPLSFAQLRLWLLDRFEPGASAANIPFQVELKGVLVPRAWARAWDLLEERQQGLRTTFPLLGDEPVQHVAPLAPRSLEVVDLARLPLETARSEAERLADRSRRHHFDLARGPLLVRHLLRLGAGEHRLLANLHHIVGDGWSVGLILAEVAAGYTAALSGDTPKLPPLPVSYADFAVWQRRNLRGERLAAELAYWRETLAGAPSLLELPTDRPRPPSASFRGAQLRLDLPTALAASLEGFCRQRGVTVFMVHLAAFATVLARWSGQDEVMVGTPVAGRTRTEVEGLVGCFLNTLVLRVPFDRGSSFEALVAKARTQALSAYDHSEVPFERLLEELQVERDLSRTPLFQAFLNVLNLPRRDWGVPGLEIEVRGHTEVEAKFDLTLYVREQGQSLGWNLVYNADLFNADRIAELARQLEMFLFEALAEPSRAVGSISLLTPAARTLLPDPTAPLSRQFFGTVPEILARQAELNPERLAVADGWGELSYAGLVEAMHRVAHALLERGLGRGERVGVWAHRGAALPAAVLGVLEAGGVYFILDPAYPATRLASFVGIARPRALLRLEAAGPLPAEVETALERVGCRVRLDLPARASSLADEPRWSRFPAKPVGVVLGADDPASLGFTSGSTGVPKAVVGRHGSLTHFKPWRAWRFGLGPQDRFTLLSGLAHDPLQRDLFTPLQLGASIHVPAPERIGEPGYLARWMGEQGITVTHLTPAMAQLVTTAGSSAEPVEVPSLRYAVLVGDVLTGRDVARLHDLAPGVTVINHYGATETQRAVSYHVAPRREDGEAAEVLPLGRGIDGMQLLVLRPDGGPCGIGELGELVFRSPHLALGYLDDPELTARRFLTNPATGESWDRLYRTGDLGRYQLNGEVVFAGRVDTQVKIRGFRVEPGEVQALLAQDPRLAEVAVVAVDREDAGGAQKLLAAYVVVNPETGAELTVEDVRALVAARLPDYMVPSAVVFLDHLPMTPNGKLDRRVLPAVEWGGEQSAAPPATELETWLAGLWRELLVVPAVGRDDNFFRLGGHSLLATRLVARLESEISLAVPLRTVFEAPRLADFARRLEELLVEEG